MYSSNFFLIICILLIVLKLKYFMYKKIRLCQSNQALKTCNNKKQVHVCVNLQANAMKRNEGSYLKKCSCDYNTSNAWS